MTDYLLDTNALSHLLRHPDGVVASRIREVGEDHVCTSIVVASELRFGAARRGSTRLSEVVDGLLTRMHVLALDVPVDAFYGGVRAELERVGQPIGGNDLLIAAHALAVDCTLVTDNEREFRRVSDLRVENWLR